MIPPKESPATRAGRSAVVSRNSEHNTTAPGKFDMDTLKARIDALEFYRSRNGTMPPTRKQAGWVDGGLCPFHADQKIGSFKVNLDTGGFHCFSCGTKGGDVIDYVMQRDGLDFLAAVKQLAPDMEITATRDGRPRLSLRDALNCLEYESTLVMAAAGALARGEQLDAKERRRLGIAYRRIQAVKEVTQ